jgi:hypothetical protein
VNALAVAPPALLLVVGFIICFFGYRLLRFALVLAGFGAGLALGFAVARLIPGTSQVVALVIGIVCGVLGAVISTLLYKVGVFILGAVAGVLVAGIIRDQLAPTVAGLRSCRSRLRHPDAPPRTATDLSLDRVCRSVGHCRR